MTEIEFIKYFDKHIKDKLTKLDKTRKNILIKNYLLIYAIYLSIFLASIYIPILNPVKYQILFIGLFLSFLIIWTISIFNKNEETYYTDLKSIVIPQILEIYSENFEYHINKHISLKKYVNSGLCKKKFRQSSGQDLIKLQEKKYSIIFSFIKTSEVRYRNHRGGTKKHTTTIFNGVFFIVNLTKPLVFKKEARENLKEWNTSKDADSLYFSRNLNTRLCNPSLLKRLTKASTFIYDFRIINEVFNKENWE